MSRFIRRRLGGAFVALVSLSAAGIAGAVARQAAPELVKVTLQLKWVTQAQFAGYYVAQAKGYYRAAGLDVSLKPGGPPHRAGTGRGLRPGRVRRGLAPLAALHA
jgi:ABC-type nitrate/sulfonate/bicarbonate transport system substrate-binding protein